MREKNTSWAQDSVFYHISPLGLCGAPAHNTYTSSAEPRLNKLNNWITHIKSLGCNALYLGPLFESGTHGYDTVGYFAVDRRLGTNDTLRELVKKFHANGIQVILDGVFHHLGRDFWAFRDLLEKGPNLSYRDWFARVDFNRKSPYGDPFWYSG